MNRILVFNHHSLPFESIRSADDYVPEFLKICIKSKNIGFSTILLDASIDSNWFRLELSSGYYWKDWYNKYSNEKNKDLCRAFRSIKTSQPLFSIDDIRNDVDLFEVEYHGSYCYEALRAACWNDSPITSFPTTQIWESSPLQVTVRTLDQKGEVRDESDKILNFYALAVFEALEPELLSERNNLLKRATDLYNQWDSLFPDLKHCGKVQEQLLHWSAKTTLLSQVIDSLTVLNSFSSKWKEGKVINYSHDDLKAVGMNHQVSGESESVRNNASLRKEREFWLPNGEKAYFENHVKLTNGYRIHFYPDINTKTIFIGYIGKHLRV
ncbi:MAG: hypothetical protein PVG39_20440 [Desulfobacteraceae bacterium]